MKTISTIILLLMITRISDAQREAEFRLAINSNVRVVSNAESSSKGMKYAGFGGGVSYFKPLGARFDLRTSVNISRQVYWNQPIYFNKGPNPQDALGSPNAKTA